MIIGDGAVGKTCFIKKLLEASCNASGDIILSELIGWLNWPCKFGFWKWLWLSCRGQKEWKVDGVTASLVHALLLVELGHASPLSRLPRD